MSARAWPEAPQDHDRSLTRTSAANEGARTVPIRPVVRLEEQSADDSGEWAPQQALDRHLVRPTDREPAARLAGCPNPVRGRTARRPASRPGVVGRQLASVREPR